MITHLVSPAGLPPSVGTASLSVMTYNVLLPNSVDGWWTYKMYSPPLPPNSAIDGWDHRRDTLRERVRGSGADVVCFQEVSPESFEEDFAFMKDDLGYDGVELFKKGRFRPATFWRTDACSLVAPPVHRDRTLLTTFEILRRDNVDGDNSKNDEEDDDGNKKRRNWHVLNCHLQAGAHNGPRRLRQIEEGVGAAFKLSKKLKEDDPTSPLLVVCGDFNGDDDCGAVRYLEDGSVGPEFLESGASVTPKKTRVIPLSSPMTDVPSAIAHRPAPPTMIVAELMSILMRPDFATVAPPLPVYSEAASERLTSIFRDFATGENGVMTRDNVERWLLAVNRKVGRGSEFRNAAKEMGWVAPLPSEDETATDSTPPKPEITLPPDGVLDLDSFLRVYDAELRGGKYWGVAHDLAVLGQPLPDAGLYAARLDRIYCSVALRPTAVLDFLASSSCPNEVEPSDHLPIAASFTVA